MILTDREIQAAISSKHIVVALPPSEDAYSSTSLDLTLSNSLQVWRSEPVKGIERIICPASKGYEFSEFLKAYSDLKQMDDSGYVINPKQFVLGWTEETIELPTFAKLAARVEGKSSLARLGIGIHVTAPTIHAGFKGPIQLEICNHGPLMVRLVPGMRVCQLIFEQSFGTPDKGYRGQFYEQSTT